MEKEKKPEWVTLKPAEVEKLVVELGKGNQAPAKIGLILRDQHGVPDVKKLTGKTITAILHAASVNPPADTVRVKSKIDSLEKHIHHHKHDYTAKRSLTKTLWLKH